MKSLKSQNTPKKKPAPKRRTLLDDMLARSRAWLLACFVVLCVARPLVPSEGVSWLGDGHPFTMLLLMITGGCLAMAIYRGGFERPFHLVDAAVAALVIICVTSGLLGVIATLFGAGNNDEFNTRVSSPRLAVNMQWEWVGLGLVYFLARQLIVSALQARAVIAVMIALGVALSADGLYQVFVSLPAHRAAYAKDPDGTLESIGQWYPPDSPQRKQFEDRLNSSEPMATFALANSLAGYLAPWLIVTLGVAWSIVQTRVGADDKQLWLLRMAGLAGGILLMLVCLVLTKSRSAYVALGVGLLLLPAANGALRRRFEWRAIAVAALLLALAVGIALASGGLDAEVLTEASKSLGYRWQYWQSTLDMIAAYPTLGVGPGDFQNYYTQFKLPEASEEIRDPHNFLLEVWATAGTFAFLALVAILAGFAWHSWQLPADPKVESATDEPIPSQEMQWFVAIGGAMGVLLAYAIGPSFGFVVPLGDSFAMLCVGALVLAVLWPWITAGTLAPRLPALGVLVLSIHWLASGGITFPGVSGTFWILLAMGLNQGLAPARQSAAGRWLPWGLWGAALAVVAALVGCYLTAFYPVLACRASLSKSFDQRLTAEARFREMTEAVKADPLSAEPSVAIAQLSLEHLRKDPKAELWGYRFLLATGVITRLYGHSSAAWNEAADWYREIHRLDPKPDMAKKIVQLARGAAFLYPNSAALQAKYAIALADVSNMSAARRSAAKALELDAATPHADKKLSPELRASMENVLAEPKKP